MQKDLRNWVKTELENMEKFKVKISLKLTNDVSFIDRTSLGTNLQMGFFPYVVYNFLKLLIGSPRNHF